VGFHYVWITVLRINLDTGWSKVGHNDLSICELEMVYKTKGVESCINEFGIAERVRDITISILTFVGMHVIYCTIKSCHTETIRG
jgi:hypothetical protein